MLFSGIQMLYEIKYDVVALIILVILFALARLFECFPTRENKAYMIFILTTISALASNIGSAFAISYMPLRLINLNYLINVIHIILVNLIPFFYIFFVLTIIYQHSPVPLSLKIFMRVMIVSEIIFISLTPWLHTVFYFDVQGTYLHSWGMTCLYIFDLLIIIFVISQFFIHKNKVNNKKISLVFSYSIAVSIAMLIQYYHPNMLVIGLATAISEAISYFTLTNPEDFTVRDMGAFNRVAFKEYFYARHENKQRKALAVFYFTNIDVMKNVYGGENSHYMLKQFITHAKQYTGRNYFFYLFHNTLAIYFKNKNDAEKKLGQLMADPLMNVKPYKGAVNHIHFPLLYKTFLLDDISILEKIDNNADNQTYSKLISLLRYVQQSSDSSAHKINYIEPNDIYSLNHKLFIQSSVMKSVQNKSFEVFLQPIYDLKSKCFNSAEALIRLKDIEGNYIAPSLYIPEAEKNELILIIGDIALEKTCEYIHKTNCRALGIKKVNINLSIQQCMQEDAVENILNILDRWQIERNMIRLEITESLLENSEGQLEKVMNRLIREGIEFALDDFGTGYANTSRLLKFPFSEVKFDKSLLDAALKDEKNLIPLKHLINMVNEMGKSVLVEGVESQESSDLVEKFGAEMIQGYYFAKPMPASEFTEFLKKEM